MYPLFCLLTWGVEQRIKQMTFNQAVNEVFIQDKVLEEKEIAEFEEFGIKTDKDEYDDLDNTKIYE